MLALCCLLALGAVPQGSAALRASVVTGRVVVTGVFNRAQSVPVALSTHAEPYPLLSYAGTTYFPLTPRFAAQDHSSAGPPKTKPC